MVYLRTAMVTLLVVLGGLLTFMYATFNATHEVSLALEAFLRDDYDDASVLLDKLSGSIPSERFLLYGAYISRHRDGLARSESLLDQANEIAEANHDLDLQLEIFLNRCFNAVLSKDADRLGGLLSQGGSRFHSKDWLDFFRGIESFANGDYSQSLLFWKRSSSRKYLSPWMRKSFSKQFTELWHELRLARCELEGGSYFSARQGLERHRKAGNVEELSEVNLLIGLTYQKEAQEKPPKAATPYYQLALSYFKQVPMQQERFAADRQRIVEQMLSTAQHLINSYVYDDLTFYTSVFQNWNATQELHQLAGQLLQVLELAISEHRGEDIQMLGSLLNRIIDDESTRDALRQRFEKLLHHLLEIDQPEHLANYWGLSTHFTADATALAESLSGKATKNTIASIAGDTNDLIDTKAYVEFYRLIVSDPQQRLDFAKRLLVEAQHLWKEPGGEKALALTVLAASIPSESDQSKFLADIDEVLSAIEKTTPADHKLDILAITLRARQQLNLSTSDMVDSVSLQKHLEQAQAFYTAGRYDEALRHSNWVLQIEPNDTEALALTGLAAYQQGLYSRALESLSQVTDDNKDTREVLAVCHYLVGDRPLGDQWLTEALERGELRTDAAIRLAYKALDQSDVPQARRWLGIVGEADPQARVGLAIAAFFESDWSGSLAALKELPAQYSQLPELQGLRVQCLFNIEHTDAAIDALRKVLRATSSDGRTKSSFPIPFQHLRDSILVQFHPNLVAAKREADQGHIADARRLLERIPSPSSALSLERDRLLVSLGDASKLLTELRTTSRDAKAPAVKAKAKALYGQALLQSGQYIEAVNELQSPSGTLSSAPAEIERSVSTLLALRKHSEGLELLLKFRRQNDIPISLRPEYIRCLVHTRHHQEAIEQAQIWLNREPIPSLLEQLRIVSELVPCNAASLIKTILDAAEDKKNLNAEEALTLSNLLYDLGGLNEAHKVVSQHEESLAERYDGVVFLAKLYSAFSQVDKALSYCNRALEEQSNDIEMTSLLYSLERDPEVVQARVDAMREFTKIRQPSPTQVLNQCKKLIALYEAYANISDKSAQQFLGQDLTSLIRDSAYTLRRLSKQYADIPEIWYLMGYATLIVGRPAESRELLEKAAELDPSYSDALTVLGQAYLGLGHKHQAVKSLGLATQSKPHNPTAWTILAGIHSHSQDYYEAKVALLNVVKYRPNDSSGFLKLGEVLLELKNPEDAKVSLERAVKLNPSNLLALKLLLACLYDSSLNTVADLPEIRDQKAKIYQQIYAIDPDEAKSIINQLNHGDLDPSKEQEQRKILVK